MQESKFNWTQIVIAALITGVVTVGTGMLLFWFQEREPLLTFSTAETIPFAGAEKIIGIYNLRISNQGKKEVRDVVCVVRIPSSAIEQSKVSVNPANRHSEETRGDAFTVHISGLNPTEEASVSVLASSTQALPNKPEIALRAAGVTGVEQSTVDKNINNPILIIASGIGVLVSMALLFIFPSNLWNRRLSTILDADGHRADQRNILAYLCDVVNLKEEETYYRNLVQEAEYWSESDRLSNKALETKDKDFADCVSKLLTKLLDYAVVSDSSVAIINYNLARIAAAYGSPEKTTYLAKAQELAPKVIAKRLEMDSSSNKLLQG